MAVLGELAQITLGGGGSEAELTDDSLGGDSSLSATKAKISTILSANVGLVSHHLP